MKEMLGEEMQCGASIRVNNDGGIRVIRTLIEKTLIQKDDAPDVLVTIWKDEVDGASVKYAVRLEDRGGVFGDEERFDDEESAEVTRQRAVLDFI